MKYLIIALVILSFGSIVHAQEPVTKERTPEEVAKQQTQKLTKELLLSETQQKAVYDINLKHAQNKSELRKSLREAKKDLDLRDEELRSVLNDEQKQKFTALRASQKEKFRQAALERRAGNQPEN